MRKTFFKRNNILSYEGGDEIDNYTDGASEEDGGGANALESSDTKAEGVESPLYQTIQYSGEGVDPCAVYFDKNLNTDNKYRHTRTGRKFLKHYYGKDYKRAGEEMQKEIYSEYNPKALSTKLINNTLGYHAKNIKQWARALGKSGRQKLLNEYMAINDNDNKDSNGNPSARELNNQEKILTAFGGNFANMFNNDEVAEVLDNYWRMQGVDSDGVIHNPDVRVVLSDYDPDKQQKTLKRGDYAKADLLDYTNINANKFRKDLSAVYWNHQPPEANQKHAKKIMRRENFKSFFNPTASAVANLGSITSSMSSLANILTNITNSTIYATQSASNIPINSRGKKSEYAASRSNDENIE